MKNSTVFKLVTARTISFFGSSFSDFLLPLFIYEVTKSPILLALQWTLSALTKFIGGKISGRFHIMKTNKHAISLLDFLQSIFVLIPIVFWNFNPTLGIIISSTCLSFLVTIQSGYIDSTILNLSETSNDKYVIKSKINAYLDTGKNLGLFLGYLTAFAVSTLAGYKVAIALDSISFVLSGLITLTIADNSKHSLASITKESFSLLFKNNSISSLTISQSILSFTIYILNASSIFAMKGLFNAPDSAITAFLVLQSIMYIFGSFISAKFSKFSLKTQYLFRFNYFFIFLGFYFSKNYYQFIILNGLISFLISLTQPKIIALFQSFSDGNNSRSMGSARVSLMAICGLFGSITCSLVGSFKYINYNFVFLIGAISALISGLIFFRFCNFEDNKRLLG